MINVELIKVNDEARMVYGWASVITVNDEPVVDLAGDVIEPQDLVNATTEFMKDLRVGLTMHARTEDNQITSDMHTNTVVHSLPLTYEIAKALGIETKREGWIVGVYVHDQATFDLVKSGKLKAFSIGARAVRVPVQVAA
jgi:hypothetical protein